MAASSHGRDLHPELDPTHLAVLRYPAGWQPPVPLPDGFLAVVRSEQEVTVVAAEQTAEQPGWSASLAHRDTAWRRITFPGPLPWELVGFLADVASRLAAARIPFTSVSGYSTDHVLVRAAQADLAMAVLRGEPPPHPRPGSAP